MSYGIKDSIKEVISEIKDDIGFPTNTETGRAAAFGSVVGAIVIALAVRFSTPQKPNIDTFDINNDHKIDYRIMDYKHNQFFAFISQPDGRYVRAKETIQDGFGSYETPDGFYESTGQFTSKKELEKLLRK